MNTTLLIIDIAWFFLIGLLIGSFINVVILRLPARLQWQWRRDCIEFLTDNGDIQKQDIAIGSEDTANAGPKDLVMSRSACPKCQHKLAWYDNIPVVSWLILAGKCRYCRAPISAQYPFVELLVGLLFSIFGYRYGFGLEAWLWCVLVAGLVAGAGIDAKTQLLPDDITLPLLWTGLVAAGFGLTGIDSMTAVTGAAAGYLSLWSVYWLFKLVTGKEGMGYGDFKLLAVGGAWLGWQAIAPILLIATVAGCIFGLAKQAQRNGESKPFAFGPFLAVAILVAAAHGDPGGYLQTLFS